nr:MAG: hypothetical protein [Molluscum contagiosum virus]
MRFSTDTPFSLSRIWKTFLPWMIMSLKLMPSSDMMLMMLESVMGVLVMGEPDSSRNGTLFLFLITVMSSPVLLPKMLCASSMIKIALLYFASPL